MLRLISLSSAFAYVDVCINTYFYRGRSDRRHIWGCRVESVKCCLSVFFFLVRISKRPSRLDEVSEKKEAKYWFCRRRHRYLNSRFHDSIKYMDKTFSTENKPLLYQFEINASSSIQICTSACHPHNSHRISIINIVIRYSNPADQFNF